MTGAPIGSTRQECAEEHNQNRAKALIPPVGNSVPPVPSPPGTLLCGVQSKGQTPGCSRYSMQGYRFDQSGRSHQRSIWTPGNTCPLSPDLHTSRGRRVWVYVPAHNTRVRHHVCPAQLLHTCSHPLETVQDPRWSAFRIRAPRPWDLLD